MRLTKKGHLSNVAKGRANARRDGRRSVRMAQEDMETLCERENRLPLDTIGPINDTAAAELLRQLGEQNEC